MSLRRVLTELVVSASEVSSPLVKHKSPVRGNSHRVSIRCNKKLTIFISEHRNNIYLSDNIFLNKSEDIISFYSEQFQLNSEG